MIDAQTKYYNKKHKFMLSAKNLKQKKSSKKLLNKIIKFFCIQEFINKQMYYLDLSIIYKVHSVFHVFLLKLYNHKLNNNFIFNYLALEFINNEQEFFLFFISSLSACSLWLWYCLDAVHMLDYMYLDQSCCFISFHWSITSIVCANKHFQSNNFFLLCFHFLVSLCSSHFTFSFLIIIFLLQFKYFSSTLTLWFFQSWW